MSEIIKVEDLKEQALTLYDENLRLQLNGFMNIVSTKPNPSVLKANPFANNAKYVPIGIIQMKLDQIFLGHWEWEITDTKILGNAICVTGVLRVLHPFTRHWIKRSGIGAIPFELKSGSNPNEAEKINAKAVTKNAPAANAEAFKNACKTLGNMFGRHLNRDFDANYKPEDQIDDLLNKI